MKSVLVTGATGFVGRHSLIPLLNKHFQVHATFSQTVPVSTHTSIHWHQLDLHNAPAVEKLVQTLKPSHLLHLAWYAKPNIYWTSPLNIQWLGSSLHLLNTFIACGGQRVVYAGSCAEYDWQHTICQELRTPCLPHTLYGRAKYALHLLSDIVAKQENISLAWARLFFLFGAHEYPQRLVPAVINNLRAQKTFDVMNAKHIRDFMYINDVAEALVTLLDTDVTGPINIASGKKITVGELVTTIAQKLNASAYVHYRDGATASDDVSITADVTRLFTEVKWQPKYSLDAALDETIQWWSGRK